MEIKYSHFGGFYSSGSRVCSEEWSVSPSNSLLFPFRIKKVAHWTHNTHFIVSLCSLSQHLSVWQSGFVDCVKPKVALLNIQLWCIELLVLGKQMENLQMPASPRCKGMSNPNCWERSINLAAHCTKWENHSTRLCVKRHSLFSCTDARNLLCVCAWGSSLYLQLATRGSDPSHCRRSLQGSRNSLMPRKKEVSVSDWF